MVCVLLVAVDDSRFHKIVKVKINFFRMGLLVNDCHRLQPWLLRGCYSQRSNGRKQGVFGYG